ncbi:uncharacterized protein LOC143773979 [Ranitomeya variabilis]|uniref:uncharacterized protein LOC143773979 n=1 Tax=Ranitomeya variabilis TaxID=490064 RepID=UPI004057759E
MFSGSHDLNSLVSSTKPGHSECSSKCYRNPTNQYHAPGRIPRTQDKESGTTTATQTGGGKKEKVKVPTGYRRLPAEPCLSVAGYSAFHQTAQLDKLFWFHRQQARVFKLCFFFREQSWPPKRKTRRGGQCKRGTQKPGGDSLTESLKSTFCTVHFTGQFTVHYTRPFLYFWGHSVASLASSA